MSKQTVGSVDFGGASLELAFEAVNSTQHVTLYYHDYALYTHSYLCYGRDQMELRLLANLARNVTKGGQTVENPCLPQGFQMNRTVDTIWSIPCVTAHRPCMCARARVCLCMCKCGCHTYVAVQCCDACE